MVDYVGFAGWSSRLGAMAYPLWTKQSTAWKHMKAARWTQGWTQGWCLPSVFMGDHLTRRNMQSETVQLTSLGIWNVSLEACQRLSSGQNFTAWLLMLGEKLWQPSERSAWVKLRLRTLFCRVPVSWKMLSFIVQHHLKSGLDGLSWVGNPQERLLS